MADNKEDKVKDLINEPKTSDESSTDHDQSPHHSLLMKSRISSPFATPVSKRPLEQCSLGDMDPVGKKIKINNDDDFLAGNPDSKGVSEEKRDLMKILKKKEDILRKLKLVKMYRAKNNLTDLEELISKWRSISQSAAQDLFDKLAKDKMITMGQFLDGLRISHELIKYCEEDETFY